MSVVDQQVKEDRKYEWEQRNTWQNRYEQELDAGRQVTYCGSIPCLIDKLAVLLDARSFAANSVV